MSTKPPARVLDVLASFEALTKPFSGRELEWALRNAVEQSANASPEAKRSSWAEWVAFTLQTREVVSGGPWGTHFQPCMSGTNGDGSPFYTPDLREADGESIAYWSERAKSARHPTLVARYADLVWDATKFITHGEPGIEFARLAIDNYIKASRLDDGSAWNDTHENLGRALELAISVNDATRTHDAVTANLEYVDRTSDDDKIGTYCYLFDRLLPAKRGPALTEAQELQLVERFESKFAAMIAPDSNWHAEPHGPQAVGGLLAAYYKRRGRLTDRTRVLRGIAETQERRATIGVPLMGVLFLDAARRTYQDAGLREEAERVQRQAQMLGPEAIKGMEATTAEVEVTHESRDQFLAEIMKGGLATAIVRFARCFVPRQSEIIKRMEERDRRFIAHKLFPMIKMRHGHIVAHMGDETGDPDGKMVHETANLLQFRGPWMAWTLQRLIREGFTTAQALKFVKRTPTFEEDRPLLVERGVEAHLRGDYVQAAHVLIPQIERAIRTGTFLSGKPSNTAHRTGRGVMQFKNLNDLLQREGWSVRGARGEDLRMYLMATLAHPKGMNIRNDVAHGLLTDSDFNLALSERILHVLFAVALIRPKPISPPDSGGGPPEPTS